MSIYNIKRNIIGVYLITCKATNKSYVGASVDISARLSTHFGRDAKKYKNREFYQDILKYGRDEFVWEVLETCSKDELLEREIYYYRKFKPEYNIIEPCAQPLLNDEVKRRSLAGSALNGEKLKVKYDSDEYKKLFRNVQKKRFKAVIMVDEQGKETTFENMSDCAKFITDNTTFKGKNKVSKIKAVCDGERPTAYGYKFRYANKV